MNLLYKQLLQAIALGMLLPGLLFGTITESDWVDDPSYEEPSPTIATTPENEKPESIEIPVLQDSGEVEMMGLENYICCVVLGEMPANFEVDALKAQAVAARTYTLRCIQEGDRHPQGAVCTDYRCCQSYKEPEEYLASGGSQEKIDKVFTSVRETAGEVIRYDGELIYATYFASSGGCTEDASEVWGQAFPYLKAVYSPGERDTEYQGDRTTYTLQGFQDKLGVTLTGNPESWFGWTTYTIGGGVDLMRIGGRLYTGVELRSLFGLRSTIFSVTTTEDSITFETYGYGHRVGLSQYGADAMAVNGKDYHEILAHYYWGTTVEQY